MSSRALYKKQELGYACMLFFLTEFYRFLYNRRKAVRKSRGVFTGQTEAWILQYSAMAMAEIL
jgi:hypothetical protein